MRGHIWDNVSADAKDLLRGMLTVDPHQRYTVEQCLSHPWIRVSHHKMLLKTVYEQHKFSHPDVFCLYLLFT